MQKSEYKYMVATRCFTYNQAPYIINTLEGFVSQKTSFPVVYIVVDDASTDNEPNVIKSFFDSQFNLADGSVFRAEETDDYVLYYAQHSVNLNCFFAVLLLKYNHNTIWEQKYNYVSEWLDTSKYHAICEGDDYWTDSQKIQNQVNIMENNPDVSMVFTAFKTVDQFGHSIEISKFRHYQSFSRSGNIFARLLWCNHILTLTVCMRKEVSESVLYKAAPCRLDYLFFLTSAAMGNCVYIPEETGAYRITSTGSVSTSSSQIRKMMDELSGYFSLAYLNNETVGHTPYERKHFTEMVIVCQAFRNPRLLLELLKKNYKLIVLIPVACVVKLINVFGVRFFKHYNPYKFYDIIESKMQF